MRLFGTCFLRLVQPIDDEQMGHLNDDDDDDERQKTHQKAHEKETKNSQTRETTIKIFDAKKNTK